MTGGRPSEADVARVRACPHRRTEAFIDSDFTGTGVYCVDCRGVLTFSRDRRPPPPGRGKTIVEWAREAGGGGA